MIHSMGRGFKVCMDCFPFEVLSGECRQDLVEINDIREIPSEFQVRQAITELYKKGEESPDKCVYIKFPYGIMDYDGLSTLLMYHNYMALKKKIHEEKLG